MSTVFDTHTEKALRNAQRLMSAGETEVAVDLTVKTVKKNVLHKGKDMLEMFYGRHVYEEIKSPADGAKYIFISKCAADAYSALEGKNQANSNALPWAKKDNLASDSRLQDVFLWLQKRNRSIEDADNIYFKKMVSVLEDPRGICFKMSERIASIKPLDIVRQLVLGSITITNNGELR